MVLFYPRSSNFNGHLLPFTWDRLCFSSHKHSVHFVVGGKRHLFSGDKVVFIAFNRRNPSLVRFFTPIWANYIRCRKCLKHPPPPKLSLWSNGRRLMLKHSMLTSPSSWREPLTTLVLSLLKTVPLQLSAILPLAARRNLQLGRQVKVQTPQTRQDLVLTEAENVRRAPVVS